MALKRRTRSHISKRDEEEEEDVADERKRVELGLTKDEQADEVADLLVVKRLTRVFAGLVPSRDVVAVDNVSVGIKSGEVRNLISRKKLEKGGKATNAKNARIFRLLFLPCDEFLMRKRKNLFTFFSALVGWV